MFNLKNKLENVTLHEMEENFILSSHVHRLAPDEVQKLFVRTFSTDDGRKTLAYLQNITFQRALAAESTDQQLRYIEGQRSLVATIMRLIERGKQN